MKSTFETMTFFSQARRTCGTTHFIRLCTILLRTTALFRRLIWQPVLVVEEAGVPGENH